MNLFKMELCRAVKSKSNYIILLCCFALMVLGTYLFSTIATKQFGGENIFKDVTGESHVIAQFSQRMVLTFLTVFAAIFYVAPYRHGYVKNVLLEKKKRYGFVGAEFAVGVIYTFVLFVVAVFALVASLYVFLRDIVVFKDVPQLLSLLGVQFVAHLAWLAVVLLLASLSRNIAVVMPVTLVYSMVVHTLLMLLFSYLVNGVFKWSTDFKLQDYTVLGSVSGGSMPLDTDYVGRALIVSGIYLVLSLGLSFFVLRRKDV